MMTTIRDFPADQAREPHSKDLSDNESMVETINNEQTDRSDKRLE